MKILNLDNWCDEATDIVEEVADIDGNNPVPMRFSEGERFVVDGIISNLNYLCDRWLVDKCPNLKFIASCTTGLDHIDTEYCKAKGIKIISLQGETGFLQDVWATAEHTWALIMALIRKVPWAFDDVKQGNWDREAWQGTELRGKTLGIVGYGRVGRQVARIAKAFGTEVIFYDPEWLKHLDNRLKFDTFQTIKELTWAIDERQAFDIVNRVAGASKISLLEDKKEWFNYVLRQSDIITVHVPLNAETKGMFVIEQFKQMKPTAYFINTSRGQIVNTYDLVHALRKGIISGGALDVLDGEPEVRITGELIGDLENLLITPHCGGNTAESRRKTQLFIAEKIAQYIKESAK